MNDIAYIVLLLLCSINCLLHGLALVILLKLNKQHRRSSQWCCLVNLCASELLQNVLRFVLYSLKLYWDIHPRESKIVGNSIIHIQLVLNTGIIYLCLLGMILITGDRLLCILLDLRYRIYWSYLKTQALVFWTWVTNLSIAIVLSCHMHTIISERHYTAAQNMDNLLIYVLTTLSLFFLSFATLSYGIIFHKYLISRREALTDDVTPLSAWRAFQSSKFFISVLLVGSFLFLWVVPTLIVNFTELTNRNKSLPDSLIHYVNISYVLSDLVDGLIYVFLRPLIQKQIRKRFSTTRSTISRYARNIQIKRSASAIVEADIELQNICALQNA